jgi:hypothetical protein
MMSPQTIATLAGVDLEDIAVEVERQGFPDAWTVPADWARTIRRRIGESAARTGTYDPEIAAAWLAGQVVSR